MKDTRKGKYSTVDDSVVITTREAARLLGVSTTQVRTLAKLGKFSCFQPGKRLFFYRTEVQRYFESTKVIFN
jgi:excisionase family DNA binding protein